MDPVIPPLATPQPSGSGQSPSHPLIPNPPSKGFEKPLIPNSSLTNFDLTAYSGGTAAFLATQYYSRTYPHLAVEVSKNLLGPEFNAAGKPKATISNFGATLFILPMPFGYIDPINYDLEPNYLNNFNKNLKQMGRGMDVFSLPESSILKTLPDTDPRTVYGMHKLRARRQFNELQDLLPKLSNDALFELRDLARGPDRDRLLYEPERIERYVNTSLASRFQEPIPGSPGQGFNSALNDYRLRQPQPALPSLLALPTTVPSPISPSGEAPPANRFAAINPLYETRVPRAVRRAIVSDVDQILGAQYPRGSDVTVPRALIQAGAFSSAAAVNTRPSNNLVAEAAERAPEMLKHLESERADP